MTQAHRPDTVLVHAGRDPEHNHGIVNPPVYHASTILWPTVAAMEAATGSLEGPAYRYGRVGTPTSEAFESAVAALEGGHRSIATQSGLSAVTLTLMTFLASGDHALIADSCYGPTRAFASKVLSKYGVQAEFYDPLIGGGIAAMLRPETKLVYMESPGSLTFEVQDVPAIVAACRARGVVTAIDNTWASPLFFKALEHGVDIVLHAATKYIVGHSDANMGVVTAASREHWLALKAMAVMNGMAAGPDDLFLAQRGLRTLAVRLRQHERATLAVAHWLQGRPEVRRVLYPALPDDPGHALWKRDFTGSSGLFGVLLTPFDKPAVAAMLDGMSLFKMGASWGGFESLILPQHPAANRTATRWAADGPLLRLHVGLEDPGDLIADLEAGFDRLRAAA
jgi:cystathionine beta-lyase